MEVIEHELCWIVKDVFSEPIRLMIVDRIEKLKESGQLEYDQKNKRFYKINDKMFVKLHLKALEIVQKIVPEDIKTSYNFLSYYDRKDSWLDAHRDRKVCFYTASYCIQQIAPWPIIIKGVEFSLNPNEFIIFRGGRDEHYRKPYNHEGGVAQLLFHFVEKDYKGILVPHPSND